MDEQPQSIACVATSHIASSIKLNRLRDVCVTSKNLLFAADACSVHTNVETNHAIAALITFPLTHGLWESIGCRASMMMGVLTHLMQCNTFKFGSVSQQQCDGAAMVARLLHPKPLHIFRSTDCVSWTNSKTTWSSAASRPT